MKGEFMQQKYKTSYPKHERAIAYALSQILRSEIRVYIDKIILFGSIARAEETFDSDVDLFLVLSDSVRDVPKYQKICRQLKVDVNGDELEDAEVDLKICIGDNWKYSTLTIYQCIRKDGISLWEKQKKPIMITPAMNTNTF